jgi:hypothetical protein
VPDVRPSRFFPPVARIIIIRPSFVDFATAIYRSADIRKAGKSSLRRVVAEGQRRAGGTASHRSSAVGFVPASYWLSTSRDQALAEEGYLESEDAQRLREIDRLRSAVDHGDFAVDVSADQMEFLPDRLQALKLGVADMVAEAGGSNFPARRCGLSDCGSDICG